MADINIDLNVLVDETQDTVDDNATEFREKSQNVADTNSNSAESIRRNSVSIGGIRDEELSETNEENSVNKISIRLQPGCVLEDLDQAYILYCEYARLMGFSVKKGTQSYFWKTDVPKMKLYHCSCEGQTDCKASKHKLAVYKKQHTRTDCKARLRVVRELNGPWTVSMFWTEHNHELLGPDECYLLRSSRNLTEAKRSILENFNTAGIGVSRAFKYIENEVGGRGNVGFTRKDAYDHIRDIRMVSKLKNYDADALLQFFQDKSISEPYFFWKVLLDDEGRLMNFYFRDCQSADDYESFGDVVSFDTTFRTNKYNLICAPFVGMNHHRQNVMFGLAFLSDETTRSFEWLFATFLESMYGKEPGIIFSDQDGAVKNAIDCTFTETNHRLCQWHINQNAPAHFGKLNGNREFKKMWFTCMNGCETQFDFEETWHNMIQQYGLEDNSWFSTMYDIRERWSDVYTNDKFTGGLRATSRSEATNKVIKDLCAASSSLSEFVDHYESIIREWRVKEREEDALCRGKPGQFIDGNRLLCHAALVYTRNIYKVFEREVANCLNITIVDTFADSVGGDMTFALVSDDHPKQRKVVYNAIENVVRCSCQMLVTEGVFCRHILKVFYTLSVPELPEKYILKRWTREAKNRSKTSWTAFTVKRDRGPDMIFLNRLMRMTYDLGMEMKDMETMRSQTLEGMHSLIEKLHKNDPERSSPKPKRTKPKNKTNIEDRFKDPPMPKHRWFPSKRNATIFDKKRSTKRSGAKKKCGASDNDNTNNVQPNGESNGETNSLFASKSAGAYNPRYSVDTLEQNPDNSTFFYSQTSRA